MMCKDFNTFLVFSVMALTRCQNKMEQMHKLITTFSNKNKKITKKNAHSDYISGTEIEQVNSFGFLGHNITENLPRSAHIRGCGTRQGNNKCVDRKKSSEGQIPPQSSGELFCSGRKKRWKHQRETKR